MDSKNEKRDSADNGVITIKKNVLLNLGKIST